MDRKPIPGREVPRRGFSAVLPAGRCRVFSVKGQVGTPPLFRVLTSRPENAERTVKGLLPLAIIPGPAWKSRPPILVAARCPPVAAGLRPSGQENAGLERVSPKRCSGATPLASLESHLEPDVRPWAPSCRKPKFRARCLSRDRPVSWSAEGATFLRTPREQRGYRKSVRSGAGLSRSRRCFHAVQKEPKAQSK